ncbi:hypothetical protein ANO11243_009970 [Dothideomycetidae sp. 11243]|nr:hypothetical protein ANO11243_009970 [fungal sp. No.11243]
MSSSSGLAIADGHAIVKMDTHRHLENGRRTPNSNSASDETPRGSALYRNNLLIAVGFLDLANALDFPANVWNQIPIPIYAMILMGLGGGCMILAISIGVWDMFLAVQNVHFLRSERSALLQQLACEDCVCDRALIRACLDMNRRELGWELLDRIALDFSMTVSAFLVGAGTLMAIRGDIATVFKISNLLSGYVGNALMPVYALLNALWSGYMWGRARKHGDAIRQSAGFLGSELVSDLQGRVKKHQRYALALMCTAWVTAIGSMISATKWQGYVVLAPSIVGSISCIIYWRTRLGYTRTACPDWITSEPGFDIWETLRAMKKAKSVVKNLGTDEKCLEKLLADHQESEESLQAFMKTLGLNHAFISTSADQISLDGEGSPRTLLQAQADAEACIMSSGARYFEHNERFLEELAGGLLTIQRNEGIRNRLPEHKPG